MIGQVLTITSGKGGVGKTTATANLGAALASSGQRVVCVDTDIGLRNLDLALGLEDQIVYDLIDYVEGRCRLSQAMIQDSRVPSLQLIPAAQKTDKTSLAPSDMVRICAELRTEQDWILIDSPAGIERGFRIALAPADRVLIITNPGVAAIRDADRIIRMVEEEKKSPPWLIINRLNPSLVDLGEMMGAEDIHELLAIELIGIIPEDDQILISINRGFPVALDGKNRAGQAYRNAARRMHGEEVPFMDYRKEPGVLDRFKRFFQKNR
jgi:septum site-determining protein MinD